MYWTLELASYLEDAPWPATKEELIELWVGIFEKTGVEVRPGVKFSGLDHAPDGTLLAETSAGIIRCRYLILALGRL